MSEICTSANIPDTVRGRKELFLAAKNQAEQGYWTMAALLAEMEQERDYEQEGFATLTAYLSAPVESGGLDTDFGSYDQIQRAVRNGKLLLRCVEEGIDTDKVLKAGRTKADLVHSKTKDTEELTELLDRAANISRSDLKRELGYDDAPPVERPPSTMKKTVHVEVVCEGCGLVTEKDIQVEVEL